MDLGPKSGDSVYSVKSGDLSYGPKSSDFGYGVKSGDFGYEKIMHNEALFPTCLPTAASFPSLSLA